MSNTAVPGGMVQLTAVTSHTRTIEGFDIKECVYNLQQ